MRLYVVQQIVGRRSVHSKILFKKSCHSISLSFPRRGSDLDTNLELYPLQQRSSPCPECFEESWKLSAFSTSRLSGVAIAVATPDAITHTSCLLSHGLCASRGSGLAMHKFKIKSIIKVRLTWHSDFVRWSTFGTEKSDFWAKSPTFSCIGCTFLQSRAKKSAFFLDRVGLRTFRRSHSNAYCVYVRLKKSLFTT